MKGIEKWLIKPYQLKTAFSNKYIYAWILREDTGEVIASASTLEKWLRDKIRQQDVMSTGDQRAAAVVGTLVAERAREKGVQGVQFTRPPGMSYEGKLKSLAEAVKAAGVPFL